MRANQLKIGVVLSYIILTLDLIIGVVYTPILTRMLGQSEYGLYSLIASVISYLTVLDFGFGSAIVVYTAKYRVKNEKEKEQKLHGMFFTIYSIIGIIAGILGYILYLNVGNMFHTTMNEQEIEKAKIMMLILTGNLILSFPLGLFSNIITAYEKFIFAKILTIIRMIISPIITIGILFMGYKSIAVAIITTIFNILTMVINMLYCFKKLKIKFKFTKFDTILLKEIVNFSFFIFLNVIVDKVNWSVDQFILGSVSGTVAVAVYNIAAHINTIYLSFSTAISGLLLPKVTKMETQKTTNEEFTEFFIKVGRLQYIIMALVITGFVLFGKEFMILWQGDEYTQSYYIACILMVPVTVPLIQNSGLSILQAKNKHRFRTVIFSIIAILNVFISIPLASKYSGIGTAIGTAISLILGQIVIMNIYYYKKININIPKFWKQIFRMTIPLIIPIIIGIALNKLIVANNYLLLGIKIIIYTCIYFLIVWNFSMNKNEKNIFIQPIKKIFKIGEIDDKNREQN